jgi:hypothetical protein
VSCARCAGGHVDTTRRTLVIRASIAQAGRQVWEKDTKLHQRRHIALDPVTTTILAAYRDERQRRAALVGSQGGSAGSNPVGATRSDQPVPWWSGLVCCARDMISCHHRFGCACRV